MADQWYYQTSGKITGPISASELSRLTKSGVLTPDTLVSKGERENWVPASQVKGLFEEGRQRRAESMPQSDAGNVRAAQAFGTVSERQRIGRFEIRSRLGAGGFGTVYRAYDPVLDREVALKVPHRGTLKSEKDKERFLREAKAAARLRHPNIVPVYEAGVDRDTYYIASAFIEGKTLRDAMAEGRFDFTRGVKIVWDLAWALQHAHQQGIVHRDVKPANIMLDARGDPLIMDFGLARLGKVAEDLPQDRLSLGNGGTDLAGVGGRRQEKLTREGAVMGTAEYMSPEQAWGRRDQVGSASDQYSLGVVLYELLCGQTPFSGPPGLVISLVRNREPPSPRSVNPQVPKDLEAICLKAMAKSAEARFDNCWRFADDLHRWLEGQPIRSRQLNRAEHFGRWCRRNPARAALTVAVTLLLVMIASVTTVALVRTSTALVTARTQRFLTRESLAQESQELARAESERRDAVAQKNRLGPVLYAAQINLAHAELRGDNPSASEAILDACSNEFRHWEWAWLKRRCKTALRAEASPILGGRQDVSVSLAPNVPRMAVQGDGRVEIWDTATGRLTHTFPVDKFFTGNYQVSLVFSPDGNRLAHNCKPNLLKVWDLAVSREVLAIACPSALAFNSDGKRMATLVYNKIDVWDLGSSRQLFSRAFASDSDYGPHWDEIECSPDGRRIACIGRIPAGTKEMPRNKYNTTMAIWDVDTGKHLWRADVEKEIGGREVSSFVFSPDGKRITFRRSRDKRLRVLDAATGSDALSLPLDWEADWKAGGTYEYFNRVTFSPDGTRIACQMRVRAANVLRIWDAVTGEELQKIPLAEENLLVRLAFSPDGKRLIAEDRIQLIGKGPDRFGATIWDAGTWYELLNMPDMKLEESPCRWVNGQRTWTADIAREMRTQEVDSNGGDRKTAEAGSKAAP